VFRDPQFGVPDVGGPVPGWYEDPGAPGTPWLRYWDGTQWTELVEQWPASEG
jgi:hypothetical protein